MSSKQVFNGLVKLSKKYHLVNFNVVNLDKLEKLTDNCFNGVDDEMSTTINLINEWFPSLNAAINKLGVQWPWDIDLEIQSIMKKAGYTFKEPEFSNDTSEEDE